MSYFSVLYTIIGIHTLITVSPGPNFLMSAKFGLCTKKVYGLYVTFGIATGALFHILISLFGFSERLVDIISQDYLKIFGSIYFLYLGIKLFFSKDLISKEKGVQANLMKMISFIKAYRIGFFTMLFNPKSAIHFMIVFSSMMDRAMPLSHKLMICFLLPVITFSWHTFVMFSFSFASVKLFYRRFFKVIDPLFGGVLFFMAYRTVAEIDYECLLNNCAELIVFLMN